MKTKQTTQTHDPVQRGSVIIVEILLGTILECNEPAIINDAKSVKTVGLRLRRKRGFQLAQTNGTERILRASLAQMRRGASWCNVVHAR